MKVPFCRVDCSSGNELRYVQEVLASGWLTTAGKTFEFEKQFAAAVGAKYAIAVSSATAALHLALEAIGLGPGDEVLVPSLTFTATAEVVRYLGADPVFCDVEYGTGLLTPEIVAKALDAHPRIKAVMVVHFAGQSAQMLPGGADASSVAVEQASPPAVPPTATAAPGCSQAPSAVVAEAAGDVGSATRSDSRPSVSIRGSTPAPGILAVCRQRGVRVIEDAAHAFPTRHAGRMVGTFGDITCFSFYANKTITTGEGGMFVTDDEALAKRARVMRLHGIDRDIWNRFTATRPSWEYDVVAPGYKYNLPDLAAAVGLAQLERAHEFRDQRQAVAQRYLAALADLPGVDLPRIHCVPEDHAWHFFWIVLRPEACLDRNAFIEGLIARDIGFSVHYKPLHHMTYYRERYQLRAEDYQHAERHWRGCVSLPLYPGMSPAEQDYVIEAVRTLLG